MRLPIVVDIVLPHEQQMAHLETYHSRLTLPS
jgi:hypothetical protein